MFKYFISFFIIICVSINVCAQDNSSEEIDSVQYKTGYGLRLGIDISKPILKLVNSDYSGLEFVADYRISKNWYLAAEFGTEENLTKEDFFSSNSSGTYARIGANYNFYKNWLDMNNEIFFGFRYGISSFDQTLENNTINSGNTYFLGNQTIVNRKDSGLSAQWLEMMVGIKVETFKNFFISFSGGYKLMVAVDDPNNFQAIYSPGFNRIFASNTGFGFNYTLSYLIPFKKK